jgi:hypothetical protein
MLRFFVASLMMGAAIQSASAGVAAQSQLTISNFLIKINSGTVTPTGDGTSIVLSALAGTDSDVLITAGVAPQSANAADQGATADSSTDGNSAGSGDVLVPPGVTFVTDAAVTAGDATTIAALPIDAIASAALDVEFGVSSTANITIEFTAALDTTLSDTGLPSEFDPYVTSNLDISVTGQAPQDLEDALDAFTAQFTGQASWDGVGSEPSLDLMDSFTFTFNLAPGAYGFTLSQTSGAGVNAVPEPTSMAIFGALACTGLARVRRRRK